MTFLLVSRNQSRTTACWSLSRGQVRAGLPAFRCSSSSLPASASTAYFFSPFFIMAAAFSERLVTVSMSARISSVLMTSMSRAGSTLPSTWITLSSSKQRTTCTMASTSRMWLRNLLPRPSPRLAPFTRPAMSTNSSVAGVYFSGWYISASTSSRWSGTATTPVFGSMVQKG